MRQHDESQNEMKIKEMLDSGWQSSRLKNKLELAFANKQIRKLCENQALASRTLGFKAAEKLIGRLADLQAAQCVNDLVAGNPCEVDGALHGHMSVGLCDGLRIIFCANHCAGRAQTSGKVNWAKVTRIKIVDFQKYES